MSKNKVEVLKETQEVMYNGTFVPKVLRLFKTLSHVYGRRLQWSRNNIYIRDNYTCQYCGDHLHESKVTIDHVMPQSRGGKNTWENTVCSCYACNNAKADRTPEEAKLKLKTKPRAPMLLDFFTCKFSNLGLELSQVLA
jgi:5-methylcytosine-specific restriction endonuclease McrA